MSDLWDDARRKTEEIFTSKERPTEEQIASLWSTVAWALTEDDPEIEAGEIPEL